MPDSTTTVDNTAIIAQLNRIRGQIDGVATMCQNDRGSVEIVRQIIAARNALSRTARDLLTTEVQRCTDQKCYSELEDVVKELLR
ncbi:metal-sensing transcriptional repressor [Candidatus Woesebacteria bacterium]|nr:metal-sensing transcriptional repressor [Candidatus Woesebacteria bacterium]